MEMCPTGNHHRHALHICIKQGAGHWIQMIFHHVHGEEENLGGGFGTGEEHISWRLHVLPQLLIRNTLHFQLFHPHDDQALPPN